jgi:hypothetical protein
MELQIPRVCADLIAISDQFDINGDLTDSILENDKAEDLLVALGMAIAYNQGVITLNKTGEKNLRFALQELNQIIECVGESNE